MQENHATREIFQFRAQKLSDKFPPVSEALSEPDGLLAAGGDLSVSRLLSAYRRGIFPWFDPEEPILWWSPDPRTVFYPTSIHTSRSMRKFLNKKPFQYSYDQAFANVIRACSAPRENQAGTWISDGMIEAYCALHEAGSAHSIECWQDDQLVGGLYGVSIGQVFFGESMFSQADNASKACLLRLSKDLDRWGYQLFDCQVYSEHLASMGAETISRETFIKQLDQFCEADASADAWTLEKTDSDTVHANNNKDRDDEA